MSFLPGHSPVFDINDGPLLGGKWWWWWWWWLWWWRRRWWWWWWRWWWWWCDDDDDDDVMMMMMCQDVGKKSGKCVIKMLCEPWSSISCDGCSIWVYKKCIDISGTLKSDTNCQCKRCDGLARLVNGRPMAERLRWCHLPAALAIEYPRVAFAILLLLQEALELGAN